VKASNGYGDSGWSGVRPVTVHSAPSRPTLNPISNADGDGSYAVSWNAVAQAQTYTLQEDNNASFSSPTTRYTGSGTSWNASGKAPGTYYYRVKASNGYGDSGWSNVESTTVVARAHVWIDNETGGNLTVEIVGIEEQDFSPGYHYWRSIPPGRYTYRAWAWCGSGEWTDDFVAGDNLLEFWCSSGASHSQERLLKITKTRRGIAGHSGVPSPLQIPNAAHRWED
jgi:hypothetical protein